MTGFALATTHARPQDARIVAITYRTVNDSAPSEVTTIVVNTPVEIPAESTRIHGLTNKDTASGVAPMVGVTVLVARLMEAIENDRPVVIFNAEWFFQVLASEARHAGISFDLPSGLCIIDPLVLDEHINPARRAGQRTLRGLLTSWGLPNEVLGAPESNVTGALRLAWRIGTKYPLVGSMNPQELHAAQASWKRASDEDRAIHYASRGQEPRELARRAA